MKIIVCVEDATVGQKKFFDEFILAELQEVIDANAVFLNFIGTVDRKESEEV